MPYSDYSIKSVSLCGNDRNVKFAVLENSRDAKPVRLYKYCCTPARYEEYSTCFQYEFNKMRKLETLLAQDYTRLFPSYYTLGHFPDGAPYLEMDYIDGITLEDFLYQAPRANEFLPTQILSNHQIRHLFSQLDQAQHSLSRVGLLQMDLSPRNIIICNDSMDIRLIDFTDVYFEDPEICRERSRFNHSYHLIDGHANPELPPARQLQEAGVLLFTRLFYKGQEGYVNYRSRDSFFTKHGYSSLLDCLFQSESTSESGKNSCYYWDCWITRLFHRLEQI